MLRIRIILGKVSNMLCLLIIIILLPILYHHILNLHLKWIMLIIYLKLRRKYLLLMLIILKIIKDLSLEKWIESPGKLLLKKPLISARKISILDLDSIRIDLKLQIIRSIGMLLNIVSTIFMRFSICLRNHQELESTIWASKIMWLDPDTLSP